MNGGSMIVWDLETVPDLERFARTQGLEGKSQDDVRAALGDKFPKALYHSIVCIGALVARWDNGHWVVSALGAPHVGERPEKVLIQSFVDRIDELKPQLVTFNGAGFDLPVLRYRAMVHEIAAPGLLARPYYHRYTDDAVDLMDVLSSFSGKNAAKLDELCLAMGLPGKPPAMGGEYVERYFKEGRLREIADYCESDVVNTYRLWLRYELFCGRLSAEDFAASEAQCQEFLRGRAIKTGML
jgi:predicted PolB exonuclease-like 3'-5' exonuclease